MELIKAMENKKVIFFDNGEEFINIKIANGYLYDSLVYRYIRARENMAEYEYLRDQTNSNPGCRHHDWMTYSTRANRDIARFIELLNEAMGEHN